MKSRTKTLDTVRLCLELLRRIPRGNKVTAGELHAQLRAAGFDRGLRTVQRQLDELSQYYDIERDERSRPFGYRWRENARVYSLPEMAAHDALLLSLAEQHLGRVLPPAVQAAMDGLFRRMRLAVDAGARRNCPPDWHDRVLVVSQPALPPPPHIRTGVLEQISLALRDSVMLRLDHRKGTGRRTTEVVAPVALLQRATGLHLVCRQATARHHACYALQRVFAAAATTDRFDRPPTHDLEALAQTALPKVEEPTRVRLHFDILKPAGTFLLSTGLAPDQTIEEHPRSYEVRATAEDTPQLWQWLAAFGADVTLHSARQIRARPAQARSAVSRNPARRTAP